MTTRVLSLYRRVLRQHRLKLTAEMRVLGDRYVKDEFRKHRTAPSEFLPRFFEEWEKYEEHLDRQMPQSGSIGKPLGEAVRAMTDEQRAMLAKLAEETRRLS